MKNNGIWELYYTSKDEDRDIYKALLQRKHGEWTQKANCNLDKVHAYYLTGMFVYQNYLWSQYVSTCFNK